MIEVVVSHTTTGRVTRKAFRKAAAAERYRLRQEAVARRRRLGLRSLRVEMCYAG
jgi:hypothetical protein